MVSSRGTTVPAYISTILFPSPFLSHSPSSTPGTGTILSSGMTGIGTDGAGDVGIHGIMTLGIPDGDPITPVRGIPVHIIPDGDLITPVTGHITPTDPITPEDGLSYRDVPPAAQAARGGTCHHPAPHRSTAVLQGAAVLMEAADIQAVPIVEAAVLPAPAAALQAARPTGAEVLPPAEEAAESVPAAGEEVAEG